MGDDILRTLQMGVSFSHKKHGREMKMFRGCKALRLCYYVSDCLYIVSEASYSAS